MRGPPDPRAPRLSEVLSVCLLALPEPSQSFYSVCLGVAEGGLACMRSVWSAPSRILHGRFRVWPGPLVNATLLPLAQLVELTMGRGNRS